MEEIEAWEEDLRERIWELQKKIKQLEKEWTNNIQEVEQLQQELDKLIQELDALIQVKRYKESQSGWWTGDESWALEKVKSFLFWQRNSLEVTRQNIQNQRDWLEESIWTEYLDKKWFEAELDLQRIRLDAALRENDVREVAYTIRRIETLFDTLDWNQDLARDVQDKLDSINNRFIQIIEDESIHSAEIVNRFITLWDRIVRILDQIIQ